MQAEKRLEELYLKWFNKTASEQEKAELIAMLNAGIAKEQLEPVMEQIWNELKDDESFSLTERQLLADKILREWPAEPFVTGRRPAYHFRRIWTVAAALLLLTGVAFIWKELTGNTEDKKAAPVTATLSMAAIEPGKEGAILTLADGSQIVLDSTADGIIGKEGNAQITLKDKQVVYKAEATQAGALAETAYNVMATPKGRQFQLVLPDGTKVWLNAASSIRYPVAFNKKERRVEVSGEAYFEVAHNKNWPFFVETKNQVIQALGTSFNVNAYGDEQVEKTTLIEGSVSVNAYQQAARPSSTILRPGQQAKLRYDKQQVSVLENQSEAALAWKNGYFNLENIPFDQVMKQFERWYDIQVLYENGVPDLRFVGGLSRQMKLDALIRTLHVSEVHFKMETGRKLIVYK